MFRFATPFYFLLLVPAGIAIWFVCRRSIHAAIPFPAIFRAAIHVHTWRTRLTTVLPLFYLLGLICVIIALARPQTVFSRIRRTTDMIAIEMVVDVSGSMDALDLSTRTGTSVRYRSRLDVVKETFAEFVGQRPDDLIGLVTFGGYASTRCPLTADHDALQHILSGVQIPKPAPGSQNRAADREELQTAIGDALATACARLTSAEPTSRIIVLLSDGESNAGIIKPRDAIKIASELNVKVYTIGVGTTGNAPFFGRDLFGRKIIEHVPVTLDEALLKEIASSTGGQYFNVQNPSGLEQALDNINTLEKTAVEQDIYDHYHELFPWFLAPALGMVVLSAGLNMIARKKIV